MKKLGPKFVAVIVSILLGGCASTATKNKIATIDSSDLVYGKVVRMFEADTSKNRSLCENWKDDPGSVNVCSNLKDYEVANAAVFNHGRFFTSGVLVPKSLKVKEGNFIAFSPKKKGASFNYVAAREENEKCKWIGPSTDMLNGRTGMAAGFVAGLLIVPAIAVSANDELLEAGVECEGWSYKSILHKAMTNS